MSTLPSLLPDIEAAFAERATARSRASVDARWEQEFGGVRVRRLSFGALCFALLFAFYLCIDFLLIGDVFDLAVVLRLAVVTPLAVGVSLVIHRGCSPIWREALPAAVMVLATAVTAVLFLASASPTAVHYLYPIGLPILYGNVVQRPRFEVAAVASGVSLAIFVAAVLAAGLPIAIALSAVITMTVTIGFSLAAGHSVERELHRAFLRRVRSEKAIDHLAHRNDELLELTQVDTLTGLANRRRLDARLAETAAWSQRNGEPVALLMVDVDHFKKFNDRYGHPAGDECLRLVAKLAREQMRRNDDELGRFGGEEFLAILVGTDLFGATRVAERIRMAVQAQAIAHEDARPSGVVGVSIGCAAGIIRSDWSVEDLIRAADEALYRAKRRGRNCVHPPVPDDLGESEPRSRHIVSCSRNADAAA